MLRSEEGTDAALSAFAFGAETPRRAAVGSSHLARLGWEL